ncbi:MAG: response regulator [Mycobacterium sp.]|uniref:response regulator n=1 Tax=Mycobacterium sp. TaxID=1785 RepID=UPI003F975B46
MTRVLVIDDEPLLLRTLRINLAARGYQVVTTGTGAAGLRAAATQHPEVVVLDIGLPDVSGIEVLKILRSWMTAPVLVLSGRTDAGDKVEALDAGADDYLTKPVDMEELLARLRAAVRRAAAPAEIAEPVVETAAFTVDLWEKKVIKNGREVHLTPTEWGILEVLVRNRGRLVDRESLLNEIRGPFHEAATNYLRVYLGQLRRKLEDDPSHPTHLLTQAGMGYRFQP